MDNLFQLNVVGLMYDGIGIAILGYAFFSKSIEAMLFESNAYHGGNNALLRSLIQARTDGITGTSLLVLGFILQWLGAVGIKCDIAAQLLYLALLVFILVYMLCARHRFIDKQFSKAMELRKKENE